MLHRGMSVYWLLTPHPPPHTHTHTRARTCARSSPRGDTDPHAAHRRGQVQIINLGDTSKAGQIIDAHVTGLACISLNRQGTMLATASEKGTLLRVFDTRTSKQLYELRRGSTSVTITRCVHRGLVLLYICLGLHFNSS